MLSHDLNIELCLHTAYYIYYTIDFPIEPMSLGCGVHIQRAFYLKEALPPTATHHSNVLSRNAVLISSNNCLHGKFEWAENSLVLFAEEEKKSNLLFQGLSERPGRSL